MKAILSLLFIVIVKAYQWIISPLLPKSCRYEPSCSHFMIDALRKCGPIKGMYHGIKRILRCNPYSGGGNDPVEKHCGCEKMG
jgi:putative membrane protein insertion efficiency factor